MGIRTKHFGASFEAGLEACLEGLKAMEIGENNVTKKVPVLVLKTYEKAGAQKWASPVDAQADPWQEIAIASVLCHSLQWHGHPARKEVFNAVEAAAALPFPLFLLFTLVPGFSD